MLQKEPVHLLLVCLSSVLTNTAERPLTHAMFPNLGCIDGGVPVYRNSAKNNAIQLKTRVIRAFDRNE